LPFGLLVCLFSCRGSEPGPQVREDCDDTDPYDLDCDGSPTVDDCDDNDPDIYPWDRDGDGIDEECGWSVGAGTYHTCGVTSSGSVESWGWDDDGQPTLP
jgi:hypothetical protein